MEDMQRLVRVEESVKSAHHRLDALEKDVKDIRDLAVSVKEIAIETKAMRQDFNDMNSRVKDIENKPARKYERIGDKIIDLLIGAIVGYVLFKIGLGG